MRSWQAAGACCSRRRGVWAGMMLGALLPTAASVAAQTDGTWTTHLYMNNVRDVAVTAEGVWCATRGGALFFDFSTSQFGSWNRSRDGLASDSLVAVARLSDGQIAFATERSGVSVYQPTSGVWFNYTSLTWPIAGDEVLFIREDPPWRMIGSRGGVLVLEDGQPRVTCQQQVDPCELPSWEVTAAVYFEDRFWFGTRGGESGTGAIGRLDYSQGAWDQIDTPGDVLDLEVWDETVFCLTSIGVYRWDGSGWEARNEGLNGIDVEVCQLTVGRDRLLAAAWGEDGGPFVLDDDAQRWDRLADGRLRGCCSVAEGSDGIVWVGASAGWDNDVPYLGEDEDGLWELVGETWIQHRHEGPHPVADYRGLTVDDAGRVWAASAGRFPLGWRIMLFQEGGWRFYNTANAPLSSGWGWHIRVIGQRMWLGHCCCTSPSGGCFLDDWIIGSSEATVHDSVFNIHSSAVDARGNLWFASNRENPEQYPDAVKGLFHYDRAADRWRHYDTETTGALMLSNAVTSVATRADTLWIGYASEGVHRVLLDGQGLPRLTANAWLHVDTGSGLAGNRITQIVTRPGEIWVATDNGISLLDGLQWRTFRKSSGQLPGAQVVDLALTDDGAAWAAIAGAGVTRISRGTGGNWTDFESFGPPDLVSADVRFVARGAGGRDIWVATSAGLSHFVPSPERTDRAFDGVAVFPNPFNPQCDGSVRFVDLPGRTREGVVVDVAGRVVGRFGEVWAEEPFWDGRDPEGGWVAPGLYVIRVSTPQGWLTGQVAVLDLPCN